MNIRQYMKKEVVSLHPSATLQEAAIRMHDQKIGSILVMEDSSRVKGILTDRDIALAVAAEGKNPLTTPVFDVMTPDPITIDISSDVDSALRIMSRAGIKRLPVMENGKLAGLLSSADVAHAVKDQINQFISLEETYAKTFAKG